MKKKRFSIETRNMKAYSSNDLERLPLVINRLSDLLAKLDHETNYDVELIADLLGEMQIEVRRMSRAVHRIHTRVVRELAAREKLS